MNNHVIPVTVFYHSTQFNHSIVKAITMMKRALSPNVKKRPAKKYYKFNPKWTLDFPSISASYKGVDFAYCKSCKTDIKITCGGKNDVSRHNNTPLHKGNADSTKML